MNKKLIKIFMLYCPTSTHNSTTFYTFTYIHTLELTRWLPRHTTRRLLSTTLHATSEGSVTKVGLAIADKSGLTRWQENPSPYRQGGTWCIAKQAPFGAAHAKERGGQRRGRQRVNLHKHKHITNNKWWSALTLWRYRRRYGVHLLDVSSALPD